MANRELGNATNAAGDEIQKTLSKAGQEKVVQSVVEFSQDTTAQVVNNSKRALASGIGITQSGVTVVKDFLDMAAESAKEAL